MTPERRAQLARSDALVAVVSDAYFANPAWKEDIAVAVELGKPIVFLVKSGTTIPPGALARVGRVVSWSTPADLERATDMLRAEWGGGPFRTIDGKLPSPSSPEAV